MDVSAKQIILWKNKTDLLSSLKSIKLYGLHKSRWKQPYSEGRTNFPLRDKSGVYLIREGRRLVYVGRSATDLYKTLYRHFQSWRDEKQIRISYSRNNFTVRVIYWTAAQAQRLERALIVKYIPRDNPEKYEQYTLDLKDKKIVKAAEVTPVGSALGKGVDVDF